MQISPVPEDRRKPLVLTYVAKRYFNLKACTDNRFISELVANGDIIDNSQTAKQMKYLRFKYEIAL